MAAIGPSVPSLSVIQSGNGDAIKEKEGEGRRRIRGIRRRERNYARLPGHGAERAHFRAFFVRAVASLRANEAMEGDKKRLNSDNGA